MNPERIHFINPTEDDGDISDATACHWADESYKIRQRKGQMSLKPTPTIDPTNLERIFLINGRKEGKSISKALSTIDQLNPKESIRSTVEKNNDI